MTLPEKLDRLVYASRIDRLIFRKVEPRTMRWIPAFVLAALVAGYVLATTSETRGGYVNGSLIFYGAFIAANFVRTFGPRFTATSYDPLDEREVSVKARAQAVSGTLVVGAAILGCFYMSAARPLGLWQPDGAIDWINLGFGIQAVSILLPTWFASWLQPKPEADHED